MAKFLERINQFREGRRRKAAIRTESRKVKLKAAIQKKKERLESISELRKAQVKNEQLEAQILEARARKFKARRKIAGPLKQAARGAAAGFGQTKPVQLKFTTQKKKKTKKKQPPQFKQQAPTPGLGRFRVL